MMKASRNIREKWCSTAILILFAAVMLAASSTPAWAAAPTISNLNDTAIAELIAALQKM